MDDRAPFQLMVKPIGARCNLRCAYCFYLEKTSLYPSAGDHRMTDEVLERLIATYLDASSEDVVSFSWQGGEPTLMGLEFFERVVALQQRHARGRSVTNAIQTNGVLLDDRWGAFLHRNAFLVGISIDGPRELHDQHRRDPARRPSFDRVMAGLATLRRHGVEFNTLTVVQRHNADRPREVYQFLKEVGARHLQFIPIVERRAESSTEAALSLVPPAFAGPASVTPWSVAPQQYGQFLCAVFDEWVRQDVGMVFVQTFENTLSAWVTGRSGICVFDETCGRALVAEHNGDIYPCDHFVYPEHRLGNIVDEPFSGIASRPALRAFGLEKREALPRACRECAHLSLCHGACPKHRFALTADGEPSLNYLCPGYQAYFSHVEPCMAYLAEELRLGRPASGVMDWVRQSDPRPARPSTRRVGRNDPCPCGSGRKHKRCCGRG